MRGGFDGFWMANLFALRKPYPKEMMAAPDPVGPENDTAQLTARAQALYKKLQRKYAVFYDEAGAIGRRYRRQDEIGTPWCVTIDFDTIEKPGDTFTLRERDSMTQKRITEAELFALLDEQVY